MPSQLQCKVFWPSFLSSTTHDPSTSSPHSLAQEAVLLCVGSGNVEPSSCQVCPSRSWVVRSLPCYLQNQQLWYPTGQDMSQEWGPGTGDNSSVPLTSRNRGMTWEACRSLLLQGSSNGWRAGNGPDPEGQGS